MDLYGSINKRKNISFFSYVIFSLYCGIALSVLGLSVYIPWVYIGLLVIFSVYRMACGRFLLRIKSNFVLPIVLTIVYFGFTTLVAIGIYGTEIRVAFQNIFQIVYAMVIYVGYISEEDSIDIDQEIKAFSRVVMTASIINLVLTIISVFRGYTQEGYRIMLLGIISGVYLLILYRKKSGNSGVRYINTCIIVSLLCILASYSKQAYLSLVILVLLLIVYSRNIANITRLCFRLIIIGALVLGIIIVLSNRISSVKSILDAISYNYEILVNRDRLFSQETYRITEMKNAWETFIQHPLIGIGSGTQYTEFGLKNWVHNNWLWLLLDFGIIGTVIYAYPMIGSVCKATVKGFHLKKTDYSRATLYFAFAGALILFYANAVFSPVFFRDPMSVSIIAVFCGTIHKLFSENA